MERASRRNDAGSVYQESAPATTLTQADVDVVMSEASARPDAEATTDSIDTAERANAASTVNQRGGVLVSDANIRPEVEIPPDSVPDGQDNGTNNMTDNASFPPETGHPVSTPARPSRPSRPQTVFDSKRPTAATDTPLGQHRCRDNVPFTGPLHAEVLLQGIDAFADSMFRGAIRYAFEVMRLFTAWSAPSANGL